MKKLAIAGASVVLAAMPVVGVFAATSGSFTDTLTVGVAGGCTLEQTGGTAGSYNGNDHSYTTDIAAGNIGYLNVAQGGTAPAAGGGVTVSCNSSDATTTYTVTVAVDGLTDATAGTIAGGNATSGTTSAWAIQSNATGFSANDPGNPFATYKAAESTTFLSATAADTVTFNPSYRVYIQPQQPAGSYVGHAVYTIALD